MIERVTVFDEQSTSIDADPTDVTKAPVYQKRLGTTSVAVKNTPLGLQFLATFSKTRTNLNGVLGGYKLHCTILQILSNSEETIFFLIYERKHNYFRCLAF